MNIKSYEHAKALGLGPAWMAHMGGPGEPAAQGLAPAIVVPPAVSQAPNDGMNKTERSFWQRAREAFGEHAYREPITLRLAGRTRYTPDFLIRESGDLVFYETKGFMRDDASVKLKVAAEQYPFFLFVLVTRERRVWLCRLVSSRGISREVFTPDWLR